MNVQPEFRGNDEFFSKELNDEQLDNVVGGGVLAKLGVDGIVAIIKLIVTVVNDVVTFAYNAYQDWKNGQTSGGGGTTT